MNYLTNIPEMLRRFLLEYPQYYAEGDLRYVADCADECDYDSDDDDSSSDYETESDVESEDYISDLESEEEFE
tara:strand:+ start:501 stop:719 length:219 start_codon:yes stop_codon:yes gene_type:complete